ncbi:MAG: L-threonylcarbamoyladenylate synthase [Leptospiraceae bacterium]|nr:L-threonylcarbamoyladenylate synthase [Leptospiraceae bacterium]MDW7975939.1 L-threonylcarbamoyladenylate synthase [Leptospiraceae bacterium]
MIISIEEAVEKLKQGEVVAIPTETVYGLAALATNENAVRKIFELKKRPLNNPLICHISSPNQLDEYVFLKDYHEPLFKFWPGPLTILFPKKTTIPEIVTGGSPYCGFRIPDHPIALEILRSVEKPIAAPSANPFTKLSPISAEMVRDYFQEKVDVVDGGICHVGIESTVVLFRDESTIEILRPGIFTKEDFESLGYEVIVSNQKKGGETLHSPGLLEKHYLPKIPLILLSKEFLDDFRKVSIIDYSQLLDEIITKNKVLPEKETLRNFLQEKQKMAFIVYGNFPHHDSVFHLSHNENLFEIAKNLYRTLHDLEKNFDGIVAFNVENRGLGFAINDRLRKASSWRINKMT